MLCIALQACIPLRDAAWLMLCVQAVCLQYALRVCPDLCELLIFVLHEQTTHGPAAVQRSGELPVATDLGPALLVKGLNARRKRRRRRSCLLSVSFAMRSKAALLLQLLYQPMADIDGHRHAGACASTSLAWTERNTRQDDCCALAQRCENACVPPSVSRHYRQRVARMCCKWPSPLCGHKNPYIDGTQSSRLPGHDPCFRGSGGRGQIQTGPVIVSWPLRVRLPRCSNA